MNPTVLLYIHAHAEASNVHPLVYAHRSPLTVPSTESPYENRTLHLSLLITLIISFGILVSQHHLDSCDESVGLKFEMAHLSLTLLQLLQIDVAWPREVFAVVWWEEKLSDAEKGLTLPEEDKTFKEAPMLLPVVFSVL